MNDSEKTKAQLISELAQLRACLMDLQKSQDEHKQMERALRESEEKYRQLVENALEGVWAINADAKISFVNPRMAEIFGYTVDEMMGKSIFSLVDEEGAEIIRRNLERRKQGFKDRYDLPFIRKDGTRAFASVASGPILDEGGNFMGAITVVGDITRRKRAEEALRESEERYRRLSESLEAAVRKKVAELIQAKSLASIGQMVSVVAHEIRNPLQNIQLGVDAIRDDAGQDKDKLETLEWIDTSIRRLNNMVTELLDYSKPVKLEYSSRPIREIVDEALKGVAGRLRNITTHIELASEDQPVSLDAAKTMRVLVNLITNAVEAMPEGGELWIRSEFGQCEDVTFLRLSVSDTGCGIEEKDLDRVQEPFFTTKKHGTGLGLAICKKIIDAHG
ncbi:PAS domain S-box protein, partial [Candidatus Poribacteria bacterium]|nr:PAS domain S-box protein [Candidatus Poribacteria bacterium]